METATDGQADPRKWLVRPARAEDDRRLASLSGQLGYGVDLRQVRRSLAAILANEEHALLVAVRPDGLVIGWAHIFRRLLIMYTNSAELGGLIVDQAYRGQGVGRALIQAAEEWAITRLYSPLTIRSNMTREGARAFYLALGYELIKTSNTFMKVLDGRD